MAQNVVITRKTELTQPVSIEKLSGYVFTVENQGHTFKISTLLNGAKQSVSGTVIARLIRADNATLSIGGSISSGDAVITLPKDAYNVPGRFRLSVYVVKDGVTVCIYAATGTVERGTTDTIVDEGHLIPDITEIIAAIDEVNQARDNANSAASSANTAASNANTATANANTAKNSANTAANRANTAASSIENLTAEATTLSAGSSATASYNATDHKFSFGIPKGDKGDTGAKGDTGSKGDKGNKGDKGDKGDTGATPEIAIGTVTTVNPDQSAAVSIRSGSTAENPIFDFSIPRGMTGSVENVYGSTIPVSESVSTTIAQKLTALETGLNTARNTEIPAVAASVEALKILVVDCGTISSLPTTIENSSITENHVVINSEIGKPFHVSGDITITTANGSLTVSGSLSGETSLKLYLATKA